MIFRTKPTKSPERGDSRQESIETRLRALGHLLDRWGYSGEGLCIVEADGGFVVDGLKMPQRGQTYGFVEDGESVAAADIGETIAQLRATPPA